MEVGQVIEQAMKRKGYTKRDITRISQELELKYPNKFSVLSPQTVVNICKPGYINKDRPGYGIVYSVVEILWEGNMRKFHGDTNFLVHSEIFLPDSSASSPVERIIYFEGKLPPKQGKLKDICPFSGADFLFQSTGASIDFLGPDQKSGFVSIGDSDQIEKHSLVILNRKTGLEPAWLLATNVYCNRQGTFSSHDEIFGKIVWIIPKYSANYSINIQVEAVKMPKTEIKSLNWPLSIKTREDIHEVSKRKNIGAKVWVSEALIDFIKDIDIEEFIKIKIPLIRKGEMFPQVDYKINKDVHQQLGQLARDLTRESGRKYTLGMLATYAVERALRKL